MEFKIYQITYDDLILRDMGDDYMYIRFIQETDGHQYDQSIGFDHLWGFAREHGRPEAEYFTNVRRSIKGFGPKHTPMFDAFMEEGFDFEPLIVAFLHDWHVTKGNPLDERFRIDKPIDTSPAAIAEHKALQKKAAHVVSELTGMGMRESNLRHTKFQDRLMDVLNEEIIRLFPEILESDPKYILELKDILITEVLSLSGKIDKLAFQIKENG